jgi:hypothetical protein
MAPRRSQSSGNLRRSLLLFQLAEWQPPAGKAVSDATLSIVVQVLARRRRIARRSRPPTSALQDPLTTPVTLYFHRVLADWGEGTSTDADPVATTNDAT